MHGVDPARMLLLTFTRRAAAEMRRRAHDIVRAGARRHARQQGAGDAAAAGVGRHVSFDRQPAAAPLRAPPEARSVASPSSTAPTRPICSMSCARSSDSPPRSSAFRARTPALRSIRGASTPRRACTRRWSSSSPWCKDWEEDLHAPVPRLRRAQAALRAARLRRPAALLAHDDGRAARWRSTSAPISITCWSMSTRTPTSCRREILQALQARRRRRDRGGR